MDFWEIWCRGFAPWPLKAAKTDILIPERHLHCIKIHYMALVCIVLHQITEHHITLHWNLQKMMLFQLCNHITMYYIALHCIVMQYITACKNWYPHIKVAFPDLHHVSRNCFHTFLCFLTLKCLAFNIPLLFCYVTPLKEQILIPILSHQAFPHILWR